MTTNFENLPIWNEVKNQIMKKANGPRLWDIKGTLHTPKEDIGVWDLNPIEIFRNFLEDIGETKKVKFKIGLGTYVKRVYPFKENLEFTIHKTPLGRTGSARQSNQDILVTRYKAIFNPTNNPKVSMSDLDLIPDTDLNQIDLPEIQLELVDRGAELFRIKTTSGIFIKKTMTDYVQSTIATELSKITVDGRTILDALEISPLDNTETIPHILVKNGTRIQHLIDYLQNEIGMYNRGAASFYLPYKGKRTFFIYPTHDTDRFDGKDRKAIFYMVPQDKLPMLDHNYWEDGNILKIAVTAQKLYSDTAQLNYMNQGAGFRAADSDAFMKKPIEPRNGVPYGNRGRLNHEIVKETRVDGLDFAPYHGKSTSNPFAMRSNVNRLSMGQIDLTWENGDEDLLYPGMPCKCVYMAGDKAVSVKGTILFVNGLTSRIEKQTAQAYRTTLRVSIACEPIKHTPTDVNYNGIKGEIDFA